GPRAPASAWAGWAPGAASGAAGHGVGGRPRWARLRPEPTPRPPRPLEARRRRSRPTGRSTRLVPWADVARTDARRGDPCSGATGGQNSSSSSRVVSRTGSGSLRAAFERFGRLPECAPQPWVSATTRPSALADLLAQTPNRSDRPPAREIRNPQVPQVPGACF